MSRAGTLPHKYFLVPKARKGGPPINAGVRPSSTQPGSHELLASDDLQSSLWASQWAFWQAELQYLDSCQPNVTSTLFVGIEETHQHKKTTFAG